MLAKEADALAISDLLDTASALLWSPVSRWESVAALSRAEQCSVDAARRRIDVFGQRYCVEMVVIGPAEFAAALDAAARYGKRSGHPAQLNMGDCFAYACAHVHGARLLYKGNDFAQTDLA